MNKFDKNKQKEATHGKDKSQVKKCARS